MENEDVVERAANVVLGIIESESVDDALWPIDDATKDPDDWDEEWLATVSHRVTRALASAGLLAGKVDRDAIERRIAHGFSRCESPREIADAILREWGGR